MHSGRICKCVLKIKRKISVHTRDILISSNNGIMKVDAHDPFCKCSI
jgi:hypothetical protein